MRIRRQPRHSRLTTLKAVGIIPLIMLVASQLAAAQDQTTLQRPVMMDSNASGSVLFVLDSSGSLHELRVSPNKLQESARFSLPPELVPADMTYAFLEGQDSLLIAGTQSGRGVVVGYTLDGRALKTWQLRNICSGIDLGAKTHSAYVATSDSNEIYRVDLQGTKASFLTRIPEASKLGPLAFDEARQTIYVADVASGKIYQYSIAGRRTKILATGLSAPTALSYDPDTRRLYIADPGRRGIFTIDVRSPKPVAAEFASSPLKAPYGMALTSNRQLAVADYGSNKVVVFSPKGAVLFRFPE